MIANEPELTLSPHEWVDRERQSLQEKPSIQRNSFEVNALGGIVNRSLARHGISFRYLLFDQKPSPLEQQKVDGYFVE